MSIACPKGHAETFVIRNTTRQALGTGVTRINAAGEIVDVIDPGTTRLDLRCDVCTTTFSIVVPGGRRETPFGTANAVAHTVLDEQNVPEPVDEESGEEGEENDV